MMGESVFYMRTSSPSEFSRQLNDEAIEDLWAFAEVADDDFSKILSGLSHNEPFLSREELKEIILRVLPDENGVQIARVIRFLHRMESDGPGAESVIQQLADVESVSENAAPTFTTEKLETLLVRLGELKKSWGGLDRQKKAETIGKITGQRLLDVQLICDLRPVFNEHRENIEGWIPLTTLHVVMEGADGLPNGIDVTMSATDVDSLVELANATQKKLQVLRENVARMNSRIPKTDITSQHK